MCHALTPEQKKGDSCTRCQMISTRYRSDACWQQRNVRSYWPSILKVVAKENYCRDVDSEDSVHGEVRRKSGFLLVHHQLIVVKVRSYLKSGQSVTSAGRRGQRGAEGERQQCVLKSKRRDSWTMHQRILVFKPNQGRIHGRPCLPFKNTFRLSQYLQPLTNGRACARTPNVNAAYVFDFRLTITGKPLGAPEDMLGTAVDRVGTAVCWTCGGPRSFPAEAQLFEVLRVREKNRQGPRVKSYQRNMPQTRPPTKCVRHRNLTPHMITPGVDTPRWPPTSYDPKALLHNQQTSNGRKKAGSTVHTDRPEFRPTQLPRSKTNRGEKAKKSEEKSEPQPAIFF